MAIVTKTSNLVYDPSEAGDTRPDPVEHAGRYVAMTGTLTNAADDSNTSMYLLAEVPSDAILHEDTFFDVENDGFAQIVIGTFDDPDALVDQTKATENIVTPIATGDANHGLRLWEVLGMAADPGRPIGIYKHAEADAAAAGSMPFRIAYLYH